MCPSMKLFAKSFVTVASFDQEHLADIALVRLLSAGIRAEIQTSSGSLWNLFSQAGARYAVVVPGRSVKKARAILGKG